MALQGGWITTKIGVLGVYHSWTTPLETWIILAKNAGCLLFILFSSSWIDCLNPILYFYLFWPLPYSNCRQSTSVLAGIIALLLAIHVIHLGFALIRLSRSGDNCNYISTSSYGISGWLELAIAMGNMILFFALRGNCCLMVYHG